MIDQLAAVSGKDVSRETYEAVLRYCDLLRRENAEQNLISPSTLGALWERHILDSAQLVRFDPGDKAAWVDIGSGAGLPGIIIALLVGGPVLLVEPRRLRAEFLQRVVDELRLGNRVQVFRGKAQAAKGRFEVITARAVASLPQLLSLSTHLSTKNSLWVLPKGRSAESELVEAAAHWQCKSETVPSVTDPEARILLLRNVRARGKA